MAAYGETGHAHGAQHGLAQHPRGVRDAGGVDVDHEAAHRVTTTRDPVRPAGRGAGPPLVQLSWVACTVCAIVVPPGG